MWLCERKLKVKIAHFRLPSAYEKRDCLSSLIEKTDSDLKVYALHYANELLVHIRLAFQKLLQTRQTSENNKKNSAKMGFGYDEALFTKLRN